MSRFSLDSVVVESDLAGDRREVIIIIIVIMHASMSGVGVANNQSEFIWISGGRSILCSTNSQHSTDLQCVRPLA